LLCSSTGALASQFELTPFVGASIDDSATNATPGYGVLLGWFLGNQTSVQFLASRQATTVDTIEDPFLTITSFDVNIDRFHVGSVYEGRREKVRPFVGVSGGISRFDAPEASSSISFSLALEGGVKWRFGRHSGLRLQARWFFADGSVNTAVGCSSGLCAVVPSTAPGGFDINIGYIFRFGS